MEATVQEKAMAEPAELDDPSVDPPPGPSSAGIVHNTGVSTVPPVTNGPRRPEVEDELAGWYAMARPEQVAALHATATGSRGFTVEALVHISTQAYGAGDRAGLNLAFEALSKVATPLLLSQASGQAADEREEQVQEVLLHLFKTIQTGTADYAEVNFASFAKRKAISLYRARASRFEGTYSRVEPSDELDPLDDVVARMPSQEAQTALSRALDKLSPKFRAVFIQYHVMGLTYEEIAQQHEVDESTVRSWVKRANAIVGLAGGRK
jgi:RNA polymerase sigma factor (sigma-70 family)